MLIRFTQKLPPGTPPAQKVVSLTWRERQRYRHTFKLEGRDAAILLPRGQTLSDGDVLQADDGTTLVVSAAPEALFSVTAASTFELMRLTYHLANRHVSAMLTPEAIFIEPDPVLAQMIGHLGGVVTPVDAPFEPEKGAYHGGGHTHHHGELDEQDQRLGNIGELLSRRAHGQH